MEIADDRDVTTSRLHDFFDHAVCSFQFTVRDEPRQTLRQHRCDAPPTEHMKHLLGPFLVESVLPLQVAGIVGRDVFKLTDEQEVAIVRQSQMQVA